jgi:two-component system, LuxR family, sensor kinase FixL
MLFSGSTSLDFGMPPKSDEKAAATSAMQGGSAFLIGGLIVYALSQWFAFSTRIDPDNIAIFWPPAGVMLVLLALTPRSRFWWMTAGLAFVTFASNAVAGRPPDLNLLFVVNDMAVGLTGAWLYRTWIEKGHPVSSVGKLGRFLLIVLVSAFLSATIGSAIVSCMFDTNIASVWYRWFGAMALGMLVVVPFFVKFANDHHIAPLWKVDLELSALLLGQVLLLATAHFMDSLSLPLRLGAAILIVPLLLWVAARRSAFEASLFLSVATCVRVYALSKGWGPLDFELLPDGVSWVMAISAIQCGAVLLIAANHSEQKSAERSRNMEAARMKSAIDASNDGIVSANDKGIIETFSPSAERLFGYRSSEVIGKNLKILMPENYANEHDGYMDRHLRTGEKRIIGIGRLVTGKRKDSSEFPMELSVGEAFSEGRHVFTGFIRDVSERQKTEQRLHELQDEVLHVSRLNAMGELASSLAHELNQPLTAIRNYTQAATILFKDDKSRDKLPEILIKTSEQAARAGDIIKRLRSFVTARQVERSPQRVSQLIEESCALALIGAREDGINTRQQHGKDLPDMFVDRVQIQQILVNLIRNAVDAVRGAPVREIVVRSKATEDHVIIEVLDTGSGIAEAEEKNLFKPFVTTKAAGMGIGLSLSRGIAEAHGGTLTYERNPAGGAIFALSLPIGAPANDGTNPVD